MTIRKINLGKRVNDRLTPALLSLIVTLMSGFLYQQNKAQESEIMKIEQIGDIKLSVNTISGSIGNIETKVNNLNSRIENREKAWTSLVQDVSSVKVNQRLICVQYGIKCSR